MPIQASCPTCNKTYTLADTQLGKRVRCRHCDDVFVVTPQPTQTVDVQPVDEGGEPATYGLASETAPPRPVPPPMPSGRPGPPRMSSTPPRPRGEFVPRQSPESVLPKLLLFSGGALLLLGLIIGAALSSSAGDKNTDKGNDNRQGNNDGRPRDGAPRDGAPRDGGPRDARADQGVRDGIKPQNDPNAPPKDLDQALAFLKDADILHRRAAAKWLTTATVPDNRRVEVAAALSPATNAPIEDLDASLRDESIKALARVAGPESVLALTRAMKHENGQAWRDALAKLAMLKDPQALPVLVERLRVSFAQRDEIKRVLKEWGAGAEKDIAKLMHSPDPFVQQAATELLTAYGTKEAVLLPQTLADLKSPEARTRISAADWLSKREKPDEAKRAEVMKALEAARTDVNPQVKENAERAIARWAGPAEVPNLLKVMENDRGAWREALGALVRLKDERALPVLVSRLKSPQQRDEVAKALSNWGPASEKEVVKLMHDADFLTRLAANNLLTSFKTKEEVLIDQTVADLKSTIRETVNNAANWLALREKVTEAKRREVAQALPRLLEEKDARLRGNVLTALAKWATEETVPVAANLLKSPGLQFFERSKAYEMLEKANNEKAAEVAASRLGIPTDRITASQVLKRIGAPAEKPVREALKQGDVNVRREACNILAEIGTKDSLDALNDIAAKDLDALTKNFAKTAVTKIKARNK
jgi:HEAT repeat protein